MVFFRLFGYGILLAIPFLPKQYSIEAILFISLYGLVLLPVCVQRLKKKSLSIFFYLLFLLFSFISVLFSIKQNQSILAFILLCSYFVFFVTSVVIFPTNKDKEKFYLFFIGVCSVLSLISLYFTLGIHFASREGSANFLWVYYGHNHLSALLIFAIPIVFYFLSKKEKNKKTLLYAGGLLLFIVGMIFTFSRVGILSLLIAVFISQLLFKIIPISKKIIASLALVVLLAVIFIFFSPSLAQILGFNKYQISFNDHRSIYWHQAFTNFSKNPLFGSGLDTFGMVNQEFESQKQKLPRAEYVHNFFLQTLSDSGIFAFIVSILLIGSVLFKSVKQILKINNKQEKYFYISIFIGVLASTLNSFFDYDWQIPFVMFIFWMNIGFLVHKDLKAHV